jgi:3-polyprenyl-4-hydroxybenzoate decarboxylase
VDDDVDVFDPNDVEWAVATRFQPDRDLMVLQDMLGIPIDPSIYKGHLLTAKWGIDATHKQGAAGDERVRPHPDYVEIVNRRWGQYFP